MTDFYTAEGCRFERRNCKMAYVRYQTSGQGYRQDSRCNDHIFDKLRAYSDESAFIFSD